MASKNLKRVASATDGSPDTKKRQVSVCIESMFSLLKVIKTDRRTSLDTPTLSDLLQIKTEGPTVDKFSAVHSVSLW